MAKWHGYGKCCGEGHLYADCGKEAVVHGNGAPRCLEHRNSTALKRYLREWMCRDCGEHGMAYQRPDACPRCKSTNWMQEA